MPTVDLIPMLNVMMAVLAFFVLVSTTLTSEQGVDVALPKDSQENATEISDLPESFLVELSEEGNLFLNEKPISRRLLDQEMKSYLSNNEEGSVLLKAESKLAYKDVIQLLVELREVGGERVSLAIEAEAPTPLE